MRLSSEERGIPFSRISASMSGQGAKNLSAVMSGRLFRTA